MKRACLVASPFDRVPTSYVIHLALLFLTRKCNLFPGDLNTKTVDYMSFLDEIQSRTSGNKGNAVQTAVVLAGIMGATSEREL